MSRDSSEFSDFEFGRAARPEDAEQMLGMRRKMVLRKAWLVLLERFASLRESGEPGDRLPEFDREDVELLEEAHEIVMREVPGLPPKLACLGAAAGVMLALIRPNRVALDEVWPLWLNHIEGAPTDPFKDIQALILKRLEELKAKPMAQPEPLPLLIKAHLDVVRAAIKVQVRDWMDLRAAFGLRGLRPELLELWDWARHDQRHPLCVQGIEAGIILALQDAETTALREALGLYDSVSHEDSLLDEFIPRIRRWLEAGTEGATVVLKSFTPFTSDAEKRAPMQRYAALMEPLKPAWPLNPFEQIFRTLHEESPWMERATRHLHLAALASQRREENIFRFPPMLIVGPAAAGKSHYVRRLTELMGMPNLALSGSGMSDDKVLTGTPRGWASAKPSVLVDFLVQHPVSNPLISFDELDKVSPETTNGRAWDTLLPMIEPGDAKRHYDQFLMGELDISRFSWIFLANSTAPLPEPLLSRLIVVHVERPEGEQVVEVAWRMWRAIGQECGLPWKRWPDMADKEMAAVALKYGQSNLRRLRRTLEALFHMRLDADPQGGMLQ